jgi:DNA (cytosine-5)-methyltransferase 1
MQGKNLILLDLFSGIGGFSQGLSRAGFNITGHYYSEIDKHAIAVYKYYFKNAIYVGSVQSIYRGTMPRPNIITFGSPCQDFSLAGQRKGMAGQRSSLIAEAIRLIAEFRPDFFIWENVKGVFSSNDGEDFWAVIKAFADIGGYRLEWELCDTAWLLPQSRERIYLIGHLAEAGRNFKQVFPIGESLALSSKECSGGGYDQTCSTITSNLKRGVHAKGETYIRAGTLRTHKDGQGFRQVKSDDCPAIPARARNDGSGQPVIIASRGRGENWEQQLEERTDGVTNTLTGVQKDNLLEEGSKIRRLTPIECERLQGFPDDHTKYGDYDGVIKEVSDSQRYKMIGNAVSVPIVEEIGKRLLRIINQ